MGLGSSASTMDRNNLWTKIKYPHGSSTSKSIHILYNRYDISYLRYQSKKQLNI